MPELNDTQIGIKVDKSEATIIGSSDLTIFPANFNMDDYLGISENSELDDNRENPVLLNEVLDRR